MQTFRHHSRPVSPDVSTQYRWLFAAIFVIWLAFTFRMVNLDSAPLYIDETTYIHYAEQILNHEGAFRSRTTLMQPFLIAVFQPHGTEAPLVGRMVTVLASALAVASCLQLGRLLGGKRAGLLAALLYAVVPIALFHERQALSDPVASALSLTALTIAIWQIRRPRIALSIGGGLLLGLAYLVKLSALLFIPLSLLAPLLLPRRPAWRALAYNMLSAGLGVALGLAGLAVATQQGYVQQATVGGALSLLRLGPAGISSVLSANAAELKALTGAYFGWYALIIAGGGLALAATGRRSRAFLFTAGDVLILSLPWLIQQYLYTLPGRYVMTMPSFVVLLMALTLSTGLALVPRKWAPLIGAIVLVPVLGRWLAFNAAIPWDTQAVPLPPGESALYQSGWEAGNAYREAARDLLAEWEAGNRAPLNTMTYGGCCYWQTTVYLGPEVGQHAFLEPGRQELLADWLAAGHTVFIIDTHQTRFDGEVEDWLGAEVEHFNSYTHGLTQLDVYRVVGAHGQLAEEIEQRAEQP